jgi:hypothetical protein
MRLRRCHSRVHTSVRDGALVLTLDQESRTQPPRATLTPGPVLDEEASPLILASPPWSMPCRMPVQPVFVPPRSSHTAALSPLAPSHLRPGGTRMPQHCYCGVITMADLPFWFGWSAGAGLALVITPAVRHD